MEIIIGIFTFSYIQKLSAAMENRITNCLEK